MVSSTLGSPTKTIWKRRSRAASFSMYLRYSFSVVAPMARSCSARQRRLQHVGGVDGAFGRARANQGVQLVDEKNDLPGGVFNFLEHGLEPVFKLAAILRSGQHRAQVERDHALVLENLRHVARDNALRQTFDDGGLAHAGLADQHRIVLRAAGKHLHHAADFLVASDDGIELSLARLLGQVAGVTLQRLVLGFGILIGDALRTAHRGQRLENRVVGCAMPRKNLGRKIAAPVVAIINNFSRLRRHCCALALRQ